MNALEKMKSTMTEEEAVALVDTNWWEEYSHREVALAQLQQDRLCMPFDKFSKAVSEACGRPVYTHEFINPQALISQIENGTPAENPLVSLHKAMSR